MAMPDAFSIQFPTFTVEITIVSLCPRFLFMMLNL